MPELGNLLRVELRDVWQYEAIHFTPWLIEHIGMLGEVLGLELEVVGHEHGVGDFSADILARDLGRDRLVVIENQLEATDHTHLGQLITYAAGLEASVIIWVSRQVREEHRQALDWLNRGYGATTEYFGVVIELLQIDDSKPAVNLRVVASPNNWSRTSQRTVVKSEASGRYALYQTFFQKLIDDLRQNHRFTNALAGQPQNWYSFSSGTSGFQYALSFAAGSRLRAEVYIDGWDQNKNTLAFQALEADRSALEQEFHEPLVWETLEGRRACRIAIYRPGSIVDSSALLDEYHRWAVDRLLRFKRVFGPKLSDATRAAR